MNRKGFLITIAFLSIISCVQVSFADNASNPIRVGVLNAAPFAFQEEGLYKGLAVDFWTLIAKENNWAYRYVMIDNSVEHLLEALNHHELDVVIGNISVTHSRVQLVDFSRPYIISRVNLIVIEQSKTFFQILWSIFENVLGYKSVIAFIVVMFLIFIHLIWWVEPREEKSKSYKSGISNIAWDSILIFLSQQAGTYKTWRGRILVAVMLFFSVIALGLIIATFTSALTLSLSSAKYTQLSDIGHKTIAVGPDESKAELAEYLGLHFVQYPSLPAEIEALRQDKVAGVMINVPVANYYLQHHNILNLTITSFTLNYEEVAFAFQQDSPYLRPFNLELTRLQDGRNAKDICKIYIGEKESEICNL